MLFSREGRLMSISVIVRHIAALGVVAAAMGGGSAWGVQEFEIYGSFQRMTWKEFDEAGTQILKESGPLAGIGGFLRYQDDGSRIILRVQGEFFGGRTDYEGAEPSGSALRTDVKYFGSEWMGDAGLEIKAGDRMKLVPFGGGGVRWWIRSFDQSYSADGTLKKDYAEFWTSAFIKAGLRFEVTASEASPGALFVESALRIPLHTQVANLSGEDYDPEVNPRSAPSLYAEAGIRIGKLRSSVFYEGLRFYRSKKQTDALGFVHYQPKSQADIVGIRLGYVF